MKLNIKFQVLIFGLLIFSLTANAQTVSKTNLSGAQQKILDQNFPQKIRVFLETADKFEIFMQAEKVDGKLKPAMDREFEPNLKVEVTDDLRKQVLESFYKESATEEMGAICYLPSHSLKASKGKEFIEIEICFGCRKYFVSGLFGEFNGTLSSEFQETEAIINKIMEVSGTNTK